MTEFKELDVRGKMFDSPENPETDVSFAHPAPTFHFFFMGTNLELGNKQNTNERLGNHISLKLGSATVE